MLRWQPFILTTLTFLVALTLAAMNGQKASAKNIPVPNSSFEEPLEEGIPPGWPSTFGGVPFGGPDVALSQERAYDGRYSIRINDTYSDRGIGLRSAPIPAEAGALYLATVQVYRESGSAQLYLEFWDANNSRIGVEIGTSSRTGTWESVGVQGTAPEGTTSITLLLYAHVSNIGLSYWDKAELARIDDSLPDEVQGTRMGEAWFQAMKPLDTAATIQAGFPLRTPSHPRLYFTREELEEIREKVSGKDPTAIGIRSLANQFIIQARITAAEDSFTVGYYGGHRITFDLPPKQPEPFPDPPGFTAGRYPYWTGMSRAIQTRMENLSLAYAISGNPEFGDRAKEYALALAQWDQWTDPSYPCGGSSCLDTAHLTIGAVTVYDMVYDRFTDEERALLEKAIVEKGLRPLYADTAQKSDHNLHMLRTSGLGAAALTLLGTVPDMERYIARAYENFFWYLDQRLESGQTEGMTYTSYAMEYVARFADALIRVTGNEDFLNHPYVHSVLPEFVAYFSGPGPKGLVNFSDSNIGTEMSTTTMFLLALHRQHGLAAWYLILGTTPSGWGHIIYGGRQMTLQTPTQLGMPPSKAFWDVGWVALRSGWGRQDHLLAFNSSTSRLGHNQYDQNHFVLNVAGEWLITDPGYPDYSPGPKNQVTVHTIGHNALLVNGNGQTAKGSGKLLEFFHAPSFDYTVGEAGAGYLAHGVTGWERKILYSRPDYFVLVDRVQAARPVELELLYQTGSTSRVTIGGASRSIGETVQANTFRFGQGLAAVDALIAAPGGLTLTYDQVKGAEEFGPYVKVAPLEPTDEAVFITLLRPVTGSASRSAETQWPVVTEYGGGDDHDVILMEVPVRDGENGVTEWWLLNPMRRAERVGTTLQDGHVQMVGDHAVLRQRTGTPQYEGAVLAYHLANGTLLTRGSQPLVETERPTTVAVELQDQRVEATVWSQEPGRISLWTDGAASVTVNGTTLNANEWSYDAEKGMVTLTLAAMENHVVVER